MANPPNAFRDERLGPLSLVPPGVLRRLAVSAAPPAAAFSSPSASASRALAAAAAPPSPPAVAPPAPAAVPAPQAGGAERLGVELPLGGAAEADVLPGRAVRHVRRDGVEEAVLGVAPAAVVIVVAAVVVGGAAVRDIELGQAGLEVELGVGDLGTWRRRRRKARCEDEEVAFHVQDTFEGGGKAGELKKGKAFSGQCVPCMRAI